MPLFFVVLGARLELDALFEHPSILRLTVALVGLNVVVHLLAARLSSQRVPAALVATAQLGVPAAVVTLGLEAERAQRRSRGQRSSRCARQPRLASLGTTLLVRDRTKRE